MNIDTTYILKTLREAGKITLRFYDMPTIEHSQKLNDHDGFVSPLTQADIAVQEYLIDRLRDRYPDAQIVSEEQTQEKNVDALKSRYVFMIDPIDGTKEFVKKTNQFTINIGLLKDLSPVEGYVYAPAKDVLYYTKNGQAFVEREGGPGTIKVSTNEDVERVVVSKNHMDTRTETFIQQFKNAELVQAGSSLKFCRIAEGTADIYPRLAPTTMEWDTAAADAIVRASGGKVIDEEGQPLRYGKEGLGLRNNGFIACGPNTRFSLV